MNFASKHLTIEMGQEAETEEAEDNLVFPRAISGLEAYRQQLIKWHTEGGRVSGS